MNIKTITSTEKFNKKSDWKNNIIIITPDQLPLVVNKETEQEIVKARNYLAENKLETCEDNFLATFSFDTKKGTEEDPETIALYSDFETFSIYVTTQTEKLINKIESLLNKESTPSSLFMSLLAFLTEYDHLQLEKIEDNIDSIQEDAETEKDLSVLNNKVNEVRRTLIDYKRRYDQLLNIIEFFKMHKYTIDSDEEQDQFNIIDRRIPKLRNEVLYLRDLVTQLRDVCQSEFNIRQSSLMRAFTIITAIFMPLQLIAGWYGMNVSMPETNWKYTYPVIGSVCFVVTACLLIFFNRKNWFK